MGLPRGHDPRVIERKSEKKTKGGRGAGKKLAVRAAIGGLRKRRRAQKKKKTLLVAKNRSTGRSKTTQPARFQQSSGEKKLQGEKRGKETPIAPSASPRKERSVAAHTFPFHG